MSAFVWTTPPDTIERARRLYTGRDPESGLALGPADCPRMVGDAIAEAVGVHPHTVDGWIRRFGWTRPPWYARRKAYRARRAIDMPPLLRAALAEAATAGAPCPSNLVLARRFGCSLQSVHAGLRRLAAAGEIRSEKRGPHRRIVLRDGPKDGRATGWSVLTDGFRGERRSGDARLSPLRRRLLDAVAGWARAGAPLPTDKTTAAEIGCSPESIRGALLHLQAARLLTLEHKPNRRRIVMPDGTATGWTRLGALVVVAPVDLVAQRAVTALQRRGHVAFDAAVRTDGRRGEKWLVDGRLVDRAGLLSRAERAAAARAAA